MVKTLEEAIGCWTVTAEYNALHVLTGMCHETAKRCRAATRRGDVSSLIAELDLLERRLKTTKEATVDAQRRLREILETKELQ